MKRWVVVAAVAYALASAVVIQEPGCTQTSHYSLVRALSVGTAQIDEWHWDTCDKAWTNGHFYSVKAPGLALLVLPQYLLLDAAGAVPGDLRHAIWLLALLGAVLPAAALFLLVRREADAVVPGTGLAVAAMVGVGTLLFPFATLLFGHVLSAVLAFGAFVLLLAERRTGWSRRLAAAAGLLAGAAAFVEYPAGLAGVVLAGLVLAGPRRVSRGLAYAAGFAVPLLVLAAYNRWAFGSFTHLSYENAVIIQGDTGHDVVGAQDEGLFGVTMPRPRVALELLLAGRGLLATTPVVAAALAGLVVLYRSRRRAEAVAAAAVFAAFLVYNSGIVTPFGGPFGGDSPGARYLLVALPFLSVGLASALAAFPGTTLALGAASIVAMTAAAATEPMLEAADGLGRWFTLARSGEFTETVLTWAGGGSGWLAILPFLGLVAVVVTIAVRSLSVPSRHAAAGGAAALGAWAVLAVTTPALLAESYAAGTRLPLLTVAALLAAAVLVVFAVERRAYAAAVALAPLALAAVFADEPALLLVLAVAAGAVAALALGRAVAAEHPAPATER